MKQSIPQVVHAEYAGDYRVRLAFRDGRTGIVDLEAELYGEIFEPLRSKEFFADLTINPELHTIVWPNGADFAPEFLYDLCAPGAVRLSREDAQKISELIEKPPKPARKLKEAVKQLRRTVRT